MNPHLNGVVFYTAQSQENDTCVGQDENVCKLSSVED